MSRDPAIDDRIDRLVATAGVERGVVLVRAGDPVPVAGTDQFHPYQAHPEFRYLTGLELASAVLAVDAGTGERRLFCPHPDVDDRVWHADVTPPGDPLDELDAWVAERSGGEVAELGDATDADQGLRRVLDEQRVRKDAAELAEMRAAAAATAAGFAALDAELEPGRSEHELRAVIEGGFGRAGADRPAYDSIVASGPNAAVLHFSPTRRELGDGEYLLVDAGARVNGYACDVTRTWVVGEVADDHRTIWQIVHDAQQLAVERCVPGAEYREIHLATATDMARGLVDVGLLRGDPADLVHRGAMSVLFPHGVGHLIGQNVHDVAGYAPGREPTAVGGTRFLRTDRPLEPGMVVTIEPGIYFIDALLDDPETASRFGDDLGWEAIDRFRGIGGVRIEDTVHVGADGPEVLSEAIPKRISPGG